MDRLVPNSPLHVAVSRWGAVRRATIEFKTFDQEDTMPRLAEATKDGTPYFNIMDHRSDIAKKWAEMDEFLRFSGLLDPDLKEEVRRAVAQESGCLFCASLGTPKAHYDDPRVTAAVEFGRAVAKSPANVSEAVFNAARAHFNPAELVELSMWVSFMYGAEMFGAIVKLDPASDGIKTMYANWLQQGKQKSQSADRKIA
jgi:alkylhydroperoxidase family enzyme